METGYLGQSLVKGAKGALAGFAAASKSPKEVLKECKTSLETALAKLTSYHSVHADKTNSDKQTIMEVAKQKISLKKKQSV